MKPICTCRVSNRECPVHPSPLRKAIRAAKKWRAEGTEA